MIQLQRNYSLNEEGEARPLFARSYEEYILLAKLPHFEGVSYHVVNALKLRIGHSDLSVEQIAADVRLTKRTLQRRLKEQNTNFALLRDDVRFHYSIKFLIEDGLSVDLVSRALYFADRTSFTSAFKRWTGMSPSNFRRLFRFSYQLCGNEM
jgi:AraC-like DNA-binding protein